MVLLEENSPAMLPWEMDDEMIDDVYGNHEFDPLDFSDDETPKNRKRDVF